MKTHTLAVLALACMAGAFPASALSGTVQGEDGAEVPFAFIGLLSKDFALDAQAASGADGQFRLDGSGGYLVVQPPAAATPEGIDVYAYQPRMYQLDGAPDTANIQLPAAACLVIRAYGPDGALLRWEDFQKRGEFGGVFLYATNLNDEAAEAVCWPCHDAVSKKAGSPREKGLPALVVRPGASYAVQPLFWEAPGYGKVLLRADNAGQGFKPGKAGEAVFIDLNLELARTAVYALERRASAFPALRSLDIALANYEIEQAAALSEPAARAAAADRVLAKALELRDTLELERARTAIPKLRQGSIEVRVVDAKGQPVSGCTVKIEQQTHAFQFGVFEGGPYNAQPFKTAREAGFNLATTLPGWGWTDAHSKTQWDALDKTLGLSALRAQGYTVKAHGVVWMQDYGILPKKAKGMAKADLAAAALEHQRGMLDAWADCIGLWEAVNEPATTNNAGLSRDDMLGLLRGAADAIKSHEGLASLVNSPHESDYGRKYLFFGLDNQPVNNYPETYSVFLNQARAAGALDKVDIIGLQFYPGYRFAEYLGGYQGPGHCPGWLADTLERYNAFGKPIHITEFSAPSSYGPDWHAGYWHEKSSPKTQADWGRGGVHAGLWHGGRRVGHLLGHHRQEPVRTDRRPPRRQRTAQARL